MEKRGAIFIYIKKENTTKWDVLGKEQKIYSNLVLNISMLKLLKKELGISKKKKLRRIIKVINVSADTYLFRLRHSYDCAETFNVQWSYCDP